VLRCALYELTHAPAVPTPVIINEYLEVAKGFLEKKDVSFIHGVIDALSGKIRKVYPPI
jgi:N utilization substance protein B